MASITTPPPRRGTVGLNYGEQQNAIHHLDRFRQQCDHRCRQRHQQHWRAGRRGENLTLIAANNSVARRNWRISAFAQQYPTAYAAGTTAGQLARLIPVGIETPPSVLGEALRPHRPQVGSALVETCLFRLATTLPLSAPVDIRWRHILRAATTSASPALRNSSSFGFSASSSVAPADRAV